jgi:dienelactone hydrolase
VCRELAASGGCTVVSVDYRLAPEHPFPAAVDDTAAVLGWLQHHGSAVGIDPSRLAVGGQSAGATIVASAVLRLRDAGHPLPRCQVLAYPVLDPALDAPSYAENDGVLFTVRDLAWDWSCYLGDADATSAAPLLAESLAGLPPALLLAAGHDPARDDARRYAQRLAEAGVGAELVEYDGTIHAFLSFAGVLDVAREALALIADRVRATLTTDEPRLQHVGLPYPAERAGDARRFYAGLLGLTEKPVPEAFRDRGFLWFAAGPGEGELHLLPDMPEAGHACLATAELPTLVERLERHGHPVETHAIVANRPQAFVEDPFGNQLELTSLDGPYG